MHALSVDTITAWVKVGLVRLALGSFLFVTTLYVAATIWALPPTLERMIPQTVPSLLDAPLTVLLIYEIILLAIAVRHSLVEYVRKQYEVLSLILLRDIFKSLDAITGASSLADTRLHVIAILAVGSLGLYFLSELLERIQHSYHRMVKQEQIPSLVRLKTRISQTLVVCMLGITAYYSAMVLVPGGSGSFNDEVFSILFTLIAVANVFLFLASLLFIQTYESLFEYSAVLAASIIAVLALGAEPVVKVVLVAGSSVFALATLALHGFARSDTQSSGK